MTDLEPATAPPTATDPRPNYAVHSRETWAGFPELLKELPHELAALSEGLCPSCSASLRPVERDHEPWLRCDRCSCDLHPYISYVLYWRADFQTETVYRWAPSPWSA